MKPLVNRPLVDRLVPAPSPQRTIRLAAKTKIPCRWMALALTLTLSNLAVAQSAGVLHIWGDTVYDLYSQLCGSPTQIEGVADFHSNVRNRVVLLADGTTHVWGLRTNTFFNSSHSLRSVAALGGGRDVVYAIRSNGSTVPIAGEAFGHEPVPEGLGPIHQIASGHSFSLALRVNGTVAGWGQNSSGAASPPQDLQKVTAIAAGSHHGVALKEDGTVVAWGDAADQRLDVPADLHDVISIAAGDRHSVALRSDGSLQAWGHAPDIESIPRDSKDFVAVAAGGKHTIALDRQGSVHAWGAPPELTPTIPDDVQVSAIFAGAHYIAVTADKAFPIFEEPLQNLVVQPGQSVTLAINSYEGDAVSFQWYRNQSEIRGATNRLYEIAEATPDDAGTYTIVVRNEAGTATTGTTLLSVSAPSDPKPAPGRISAWGSPSLPSQYREQPFIDVAAGLGHTLLLSPDGTVSASGKNTYGQTNVPEDLGAASQIAAGQFHSLAVTADGRVVGWGDNRAGQTDIPLDPSRVIQIDAGTHHSLALREDGTVAAWGDNRFGQTDVPENLSNITSIAAAEFHNLALKADGTVVAWGRNSGGQTDVPEDLSDVIAISAAAKQSVALRANGKVVAWGSDAIAAPVQSEGLNGVVQIAAGGHRLAVLLANGEARILHSPTGHPLLWRNVEDPIKLIANANYIYLIDSTRSPISNQFQLRLASSNPNEKNVLRFQIVNGFGEPIPTNEAAGLVIEARSDLRPNTPWIPTLPRFDFTTRLFSIEVTPGNAFFRAREAQERR